jgi:hypothetical protein
MTSANWQFDKMADKVIVRTLVIPITIRDNPSNSAVESPLRQAARALGESERKSSGQKNKLD